VDTNLSRVVQLQHPSVYRWAAPDPSVNAFEHVKLFEMVVASLSLHSSNKCNTINIAQQRVKRCHMCATACVPRMATLTFCRRAPRDLQSRACKLTKMPQNRRQRFIRASLCVSCTSRRERSSAVRTGSSARNCPGSALTRDSRSLPASWRAPLSLEILDTGSCPIRTAVLHSTREVAHA
jgi:ferredoxin